MAVRATIPRGSTTPMQVTGLSALAGNFQGTRRQLRQELRRVNERAGREVEQLARELAPYKTGNLHDSITHELSPEGLSFDVYHDPSFFPDAPYQVFQELGFEHWLSGEFIQNAHLFPAWEAIRPHYQQDVGDALRKSIRSRGRG